MDLEPRLAGAPISWGVCEVPGWGITLAPERVLGEIAQLGLSATELGPTGYLGDSVSEIRSRLDGFGLRLVGGFVPVPLHDVTVRAEAERIATEAARLLAGAGASVFVTAVVVDQAWSPRIALQPSEWDNLIDGLARLDDLCAAHGLTQALHPHVGTLVETADDIRRVLSRSPVRWCLDTGHLAIGGFAPQVFAAAYADRVAHVHLKDVDVRLAARVGAGEMSLLEATRLGLFRPLGTGGAEVGAVLRHLEAAGYRGWLVLEQDTRISGRAPAPGAGPIDDVRASLAFLHALADGSPAGALPATH